MWKRTLFGSNRKTTVPQGLESLTRNRITCSSKFILEVDSNGLPTFVVKCMAACRVGFYQQTATSKNATSSIADTYGSAQSENDLCSTDLFFIFLHQAARKYTTYLY